jgi:hypothetical protein
MRTIRLELRITPNDVKLLDRVSQKMQIPKATAAYLLLMQAAEQKENQK